MKMKDMTYGFVGLGLMGGSIARAVRENILNVSEAKGRILACDINQVSLNLAKEGLIADEVFTLCEVDTMLAQCDLTYICLYPHATKDFLIKHANSFKKNSIVTDISGVKTAIMDELPDFNSLNVDFIPGHPMAGSEKEGYVHSNGAIFAGRNYILMPLAFNKAENIELLKDIITSIGFTRIIETDFSVHDHKIAFTSQLCHVIASALVQSAEDTQITAFGGGSFEDLTRIAMINAPLWTELFLANKNELLGHIESFEKSLTEIKNLIKNDDKNGLEAVLEEVRSRRMTMSRIDSKTILK